MRHWKRGVIITCVRGVSFVREPVRVLHVVSKMSVGGIQAVIMDYYRNINRKNVQFDFVVQTKRRCEFDREIQAMGGILHRTSSLKTDKVKFCRELTGILRKEQKYRIIHAHQGFSNIIPLLVAKRANVKVRISHSHNSYRRKPAAIRAQMLFFQKIIGLFATDCFACSVSAGKWMYGNGFFKSRKSRILRNAVDADKFRFEPSTRSRIRNKLGIKGKYVLVHVGMFRPEKNHEYLLKIFSEIRKRRRDCLLMLIGDGANRGLIETLAGNGNLGDDVLFLGMKRNVHEYLMASDCFILPSESEGLPLSLIEAQASGLPCFVSEEAVARESDVTGLVHYLSINAEPAAWVDMINGCRCAVPESREEGCRQVVECGYDIKAEARALESFYISSSSRG